MEGTIIDVREKDEFRGAHIENSINLPLSTFAHQAPGVVKNLKPGKVIWMCRSGKRAQLADDISRTLGLAVETEIFEGGMIRWKEEGRETVAQKSAHLPILRQVQLTAGITVLVAATVGYFWYPPLTLLAAAFGLGQVIAGATGTCAMADVLAKMPWNRNVKDIREEVCLAGKGSAQCSN